MKLIYILGIFCLLVSGACTQDDVPEVITETVIVRDTIIMVQNDTTEIIQHDTTVIIQHDTIVDILNEDSTVVVICVRHAETTGAGSNPLLSAAGLDRAIDLSNALSNIQLSEVYTTNFNRTQQTAQRTANDQGLVVTFYDPSNMSAFKDNLLALHKGETVLVVGHSNTTPELLNELTGTTDYSTFNEDTYDNLFIASVKINGDATVFHLEYGEDTP